MLSTKAISSCLAALVLALVLALVASVARADSSAVAAFGQLDIALFDLDPGDGIDPALELSQLERSGAAYQYLYPDAGWPPLREERVSGIGMAALADANGAATAVLEDQSMEGEAVSTGSGAYTALLTDSFRFTLTPYTRVVFSAVTESAVSAEAVQSALAVVTLTGQAISLGESITFESTSVRFDTGSSIVPLAIETSSSALPLSGDVALRGYAYAASVSPVPEPGPLALFLAAGVPLLVAARRRRRAEPHPRRARSPGSCRARSHLARAAGTCALVIGAAAWPGFASASSGSASIFDFTYELIDLAPDDGITPSLIFTVQSAGGTVHANRDTFLGNPWDESRALAGYGAESIIQAPGRAFVEMDADGAAAGALAWRGAFAASGRSVHDFTLTPMTHVVFSAIADLLVSHAPNNRPEASQASAGLSGEMSAAPGQRTQFSSFVSLDSPGHSRRPLAVHAITGNLAGAGTLMLDANAFAVGVSPIPEPPLRDMLLAGVLFGCALAIARRSDGVNRGRHAERAARAA
ncbi:PEP-CTERM sorting domain-containing protein [Massilia soli]|uniref:PEP-CTERM sorting domain-containing protein n=1 Tax=Massilia soli TaxID=2792854 RepID=A0ABS7SNK3_9BURK|nr:PEP-CTERM sorting domain-containing protein [Massilia soli]MBZ2207499.1 PEP-CTERM sorting domain-containing protein [Massilia soli]